MSKDLEVKITTTYETKGKAEVAQQAEAIKKLEKATDNTSIASKGLTKEHTRQIEIAQKLTMASHGSAEGIAGLAKEFVKSEAASAQLSSAISKLGMIGAAAGAGWAIGTMIQQNIIQPLIDANTPAVDTGASITKVREAARELANTKLDGFEREFAKITKQAKDALDNIERLKGVFAESNAANATLERAKTEAMPAGREKDLKLAQIDTSTQATQLTLEHNAAQKKAQEYEKIIDGLQAKRTQLEEDVAKMESYAQIAARAKDPEKLAHWNTQRQIAQERFTNETPGINEGITKADEQRTMALSKMYDSSTLMQANKIRGQTKAKDINANYDAQEAAKKQQEADAAARAQQQAEAQKQREAEQAARAQEQADRAAETKRAQAEKLKARIDAAAADAMQETLEARGAYAVMKKNPRSKSAVDTYEREKKEAESSNSKFAEIIKEITLGNKETLDLMMEYMKSAADKQKQMQDMVRRLPL